MLDAIGKYAADRVGGQAAEVLAALADAEQELAAAQTEGRPARAPFTLPRASIIQGFLGLACFLVLLTSPHGVPLARWALVAEGAGLLLGAMLQVLGLRYRWAAALTAGRLEARGARAARRIHAGIRRRCLPAVSRTCRTSDDQPGRQAHGRRVQRLQGRADLPDHRQGPLVGRPVEVRQPRPQC